MWLKVIILAALTIKSFNLIEDKVKSIDFYKFQEPITETDSNKLKVKKVKTIISDEELKQVLDEAHMDVFHEQASESRINMAWAQISFENGRGKQVYNYNLGNVGPNPIKPKRPYYVVAGYKFRSFKSFKDGARCYWITLKERCSGSLKFFDAADPFTASLSLQRCGYYRADLDHYSKNLSSLFWTMHKKSI